MKTSLLIILFILFNQFTFSRASLTTDSTKVLSRKGWTLGALPMFSFDSDMGYQYGGMLSLFNYGDGTTYPDYHHQVMFEISRFTRGSAVNQLFLDSKYLLPDKIRITADISYLTDGALNFYGFNGYDAVFHKAFEDEASDEYISKVYYRQQRKLFMILADFQGNLTGSRLKWLAGFSIMDFRMNTVDIERINRGRNIGDKLPDVPLLFDRYCEWQIIPASGKNGGKGQFLRLGLIYDTRDFETNPGNGIWAEWILMTAPKFLFNNDFTYSKIALIQRQYIPLVYGKLTLAYRLAYQTTISGYVPYYLQPLMITSFSTSTKFDGLGGARTLRGIVRNRIVGDGIAYGNLEIRLKLMEFILLGQKIYFGFAGFIDGGKVTKTIKYNSEAVQDIVSSKLFDYGAESLHISYGAGLRFSLNDNFLVIIDYGIAEDKRDGSRGFYIGVNNLF